MDWVLALVVLVVVALVAVGAWYFNDYRQKNATVEGVETPVAVDSALGDTVVSAEPVVVQAEVSGPVGETSKV